MSLMWQGLLRIRMRTDMEKFEFKHQQLFASEKVSTKTAREKTPELGLKRLTLGPIYWHNCPTFPSLDQDDLLRDANK